MSHPSRHTTLKWRRINVDAMWSRRIDVYTTSFWCCVPAGFIVHTSLSTDSYIHTNMFACTNWPGCSTLASMMCEPFQVKLFLWASAHSSSLGFCLPLTDCKLNNNFPADTQYPNDVVSTSMPRDHVESTLIRRHFNVLCPLGWVCIVR